MPKVRTKDGLTPRQREFTKAVITGNTLKGAAEKAGYAHPETVGSRLAKHPLVRQSIIDILDRSGLTDDYLAQKTLELCEAESPGKDGIMAADWTTRARGIELLARLRNHFKQNIEVTNQSFEAKVNICTELDKAELLDFLKTRIEHNKLD